MEKDNYIYTIPGKGCFVKNQEDIGKRKVETVEKNVEELVKLAKELGLSYNEITELLQKHYRL